MSVRAYDGPMVHLRTEDGRRLITTDLHPMMVENGSIGIKFARDLKAKDELLVIQSMPEGQSKDSIDLIDYFKSHDSPSLKRIRAVATDFSWKSQRSWLRPILKKYREDSWEYYRNDSIPLKALLEAENLPGIPRIDHRKLRLSSGKGPSRSDCPAVIDLNESVCRLIGYYLSEGCISEDKETIRVRFSFHRKEEDYRSDVKGILSSLGLRYSQYFSKQWQSCNIRVSSAIFGLFLRDVLKCGKDSYTMSVPSQIFEMPASHREALISGLLRGDGGVDVSSGQRTYNKRGKRYTHRFHFASVNYYSISSRLFQQVVFLLQGLGIVPTFKERPNLLTIYGESQIRRCADWLDGEKRAKLLAHLEARLKHMPTKSFSSKGGYATVKVREAKVLNGKHQVYSVEVDKTHTFMTSYGIIVHNCIPIDPLYLSWKAKLHGFEARFIELASQVNGAMPEVVVERVAQELNRKGKALSGAKILVLGVAYKRGVGDVRESPALEIIESLEGKGAQVTFHDPFVSSLSVNGSSLRGVTLSPAVLSSSDCALIVTDHEEVDYAKVVKHAPLVLDTRNALRHLKPRPTKVVRL